MKLVYSVDSQTDAQLQKGNMGKYKGLPFLPWQKKRLEQYPLDFLACKNF